MAQWGADIPSQHVDPNREYLFDRSIDLLGKAGALGGVKEQLAIRADGIVDALPVDGRLDVEELVRLESSPYFDALFAAEQQAIPALWQLMEAPTGVVVNVDLDPVDPLVVEERRVEPDSLDIPDALPILDLPEPYRSANERLQLVHNADSDDTTVSLVDLDAALALPGVFTPTEISWFKATKTEFHYRATSQLSAVLALSEPGLVNESASVDTVTIVRTTETRIAEERSYRREPYESDDWSVSLEARRKARTSAQLKIEERLLVVHRDSNRGAVYTKFDAFRDTPSGTYLMELWEGGTRKVSRWAHLPKLDETIELLDLNDYAHHAIQTLNGTPLVRNTVKTSHAGDCSWHCVASAQFTYDLTDNPAPASVNMDALLAVEDVSITLPFGRYRAVTSEFGDILVDFFPEGAVRVTLPQESGWGHAAHGDDGKTLGFLNGAVVFNPLKSKVGVKGQSWQFITLYRRDRVG